MEDIRSRRILWSMFNLQFMYIVKITFDTVKIHESNATCESNTQFGQFYAANLLK